jgi:hypothetical protein
VLILEFWFLGFYTFFVICGVVGVWYETSVVYMYVCGWYDAYVLTTTTASTPLRSGWHGWMLLFCVMMLSSTPLIGAISRSHFFLGLA